MNPVTQGPCLNVLFDKMNWPNRSEEYENDSRIQIHDLNRRPPECVSAIAMHQETILAGYCVPPPTMQSFSTAQLPPPTMLAGGSYLPPAGGVQYAMSADYRVAQQAEAARTLRENQSRELLMYAQLDQATTTATATSFPGAAPGSLQHCAPFQYHGVPHPPPAWAPLVSAAYATMVPSGLPESTIFHTGDIAAAPYQSLAPQEPEVALSPHLCVDAAAARWLVEDKIRHSTTEAGPREQRRQRSRVNDPFPVKLLRLLSATESDGTKHIASFTPSGHAFQVHKPNEFMRDVAPRYFRQKQFSSFTRQLNIYGFEKVNHGSDRGAFSHPDFQRGKPELCSRILAKVPVDYRSARSL